MEAVLSAGFFEDLLYRIASCWGAEDVGVSVAADGDEVEVSGVLVAGKTFWHCASLEEIGRALLDNPPFVMKLQRMGHPDLWMGSALAEAGA